MIEITKKQAELYDLLLLYPNSTHAELKKINPNIDFRNLVNLSKRGIIKRSGKVQQLRYRPTAPTYKIVVKPKRRKKVEVVSLHENFDMYFRFSEKQEKLVRRNLKKSPKRRLTRSQMARLLGIPKYYYNVGLINMGG